jgi:putative tributyrin esterase
MNAGERAPNRRMPPRDAALAVRRSMPTTMNRPGPIPAFTAVIAFLLCLIVARLPTPAESSETENSAAAASGGSLTVKNETFHSASLGREMHYRIYLPKAYAQSERRFPVLYLLHGIYGRFTDWDTQSHLRHYAQNLDLIIVMPDAGDSWYVNSASAPQNRFEDYIVKDVIQQVDGNYRTAAARESRAIAGVSMGGYGALNLSLKHPDLFVFAGSVSGAINAPTDLGPRQPDFQANLLQVFGLAGSATRAENDIFVLLKHADVARLPYIYLACGESDPFFPLNQQFAAQLLDQHAHYEFHKAPGAHEWKFWDKAARNLLPSVMQKLKASVP